MRRNTTYFYAGALLFALYVIQEVFSLKIQVLEEWQNEETYRRWSGLLVFLVVGFQWIMTFVRIKISDPYRLETFLKIHTWVGVFSPLFFYVHSTKLGYAYLLLLSLSFYANFLLGMLNLDVIKTRAKWYFQTWMILHVSLSLVITSVALYHIWIVFYYN